MKSRMAMTMRGVFLLLLSLVFNVNDAFINYKFITSTSTISSSSISSSTSLSSTSTSTSTSIPSSFVFVTCAAGAEKKVKEEMNRNHPNFKFAFNRKGLLTFKGTTDEVKDDVKITSIFGRHVGKSIGMYTLEETIDIARKLSEDVYQSKRLRLHVWGRELGGLKTEHPQFVKDRSTFVEDIKDKLHGYDDIFLPKNEHDRSDHNDVVFNVIVGDVDEKLFCGITRNHDNPFPGSIIPLTLPNDAPSRAWLKIEEAMQYMKLKYSDDVEFLPGEISLEIGSAPGGACHSLLNRGLVVFGIDPLPPDRQHAPIVKRHKNFHEIKGTLQSVTRALLPKKCHWLLCDANISPKEALSKLMLITNHYKDDLKGFFYTVKLNDELWDNEKDLLTYLDSLDGTLRQEVENVEDVVFKQLSSNRKEILCFVKMKKQSS